MLHDPSHYEPPQEAAPIQVQPADRDVLRALAAEVAEIAALPVHAEKARLWTKLNDLEAERPMVWINESIELIMKDISTVRYQPQRLWEWARIALEEAGA